LSAPWTRFHQRRSDPKYLGSRKTPTSSTPGSAPPLAALDARLAGADAGAEVLLPDQHAGDEPRHHHALGGADGADGAVQHRRGSVPPRVHHPKMLDGFGEGMSKSKGNGVDPLDIIDRYGTDALRFRHGAIAGETQDSRMPVANVCPHCGDAGAGEARAHVHADEEARLPEVQEAVPPRRSVAGDDPELPTAKQASDRFEIGRNFANKLWNAARFILMNLEGLHPGRSPRRSCRSRTAGFSAGSRPPRGGDGAARRLPLQRGGADSSTTSPGRSSATGTSRWQGPAQGRAARRLCSACWSACSTASCGWCNR
jgi:hypothetical protein